MNIGCFALVAPFQPLGAQLNLIKEMGFSHADVTDNTDGACLGVEFGLPPSPVWTRIRMT